MARNAFRSVRATYRRCWFRQEGDVGSEPTSIFNLWRDSGDILVESSLFTWDGSRGGGSQMSGMVNATGGLGCGSSGGSCGPATARLLGSIVYLKPNSGSVSGVPPFALRVNSAPTDNDIGNVILDHFVAYTKDHPNVKPVTLSDQSSRFSGSAKNVTTVKHPDAPASTFTQFSGNNRHEGTTVARVPNIFIGTNAANICKRYVNGILTPEPLWPWPMDQRIKEAIDQARAMQTSPRSPLLTGNSVTAEVQALFGEIPSQCRND
jgi:hypothetical protein